MSFSFFGLFGQTNKFKTVDVTEFAKTVADTSYVVLELGTGFRGWVAADKPIEK